MRGSVAKFSLVTMSSISDQPAIYKNLGSDKTLQQIPLTCWDDQDIDATSELRERIREALDRTYGTSREPASGAPGGCFARRLSVKDYATVLRGGRADNRTVVSNRKA